MAGKEGQLGRGQGFNPNLLNQLSSLRSRDQIVGQIPVDQYIQRFEVTNPLTIEALSEHPTLCYLLGKTEPLLDATGNQVKDTLKTDPEERPAFRLTEGSGMFGHKDQQDALRWRGMFNHSIGTAVQIEYLTRRMQSLTKEQRQQFEEAGYDFSEFDRYNNDFQATLPELLRDTFLASHLSRRRVDEREIYGFSDSVHPTGTTGETARDLLEEYGAPAHMWPLISKVEDHDKSMLENASKTRHFTNILDALLCYSDWTFGQTTVDLDTRFAAIATLRNDDFKRDQLILFRDCGKHFEGIFNETLETDMLQEFAQIERPEWETKVRRAFCAPSDLPLKEAFPNYPISA